MPWVATEDFDSYAAGQDLANQGGAGGTGWNNNIWTNGASAGRWQSETAPAGMSGLVAHTDSNLNNTHAYRVLQTAVSSGIIEWKMRINTTSPNDFAGIVLDITYNVPSMYLCFGSTAGGTGGDGNFGTKVGSTWQSIGVSYSANTVYTCALEFDAATDQFRVKIDGGAWSSWLAAGAVFTTISTLRLDCSATNSVQIWIDDIEPFVDTTPKPTLYVVRSGIRLSP